jgi:hypothetical protein
MALFPHQKQNYLREEFFLDAPNRLLEIVPSAARWQEIVRVIDTRDVLPDGRAVLLLADASDQRASIFVGESRLLSGHESNRVGILPWDVDSTLQP